jgi:F-type H+-transporting ATPase subunit a
MHEQSEIGLLLNERVFDPIARAMGLHISEGHHAVPDQIVMALLVAIGIIGFAVWLRGRLSVERPGRMQHVIEVLVEGLRELMQQVIGKDPRPYMPLIFALGFYIFIGNLAGQVPGFISPTSNLNITVSCAICVFLYYNYQGVRKHGVVGYLKHFAGPVWWLAWLLFPVEVVSHLARPFSLSMRLFGNILAEEMILGSLSKYIFPFLVALPVMFLGLFASTIQAFIFILLTGIYLQGALEEADGSHSDEHKEAAVHSQHQAAAA